MFPNYIKEGSPVTLVCAIRRNMGLFDSHSW